MIPYTKDSISNLSATYSAHTPVLSPKWWSHQSIGALPPNIPKDQQDDYLRCLEGHWFSLRKKQR